MLLLRREFMQEVDSDGRDLPGFDDDSVNNKVSKLLDDVFSLIEMPSDFVEIIKKTINLENNGISFCFDSILNQSSFLHFQKALPIFITSLLSKNFLINDLDRLNLELLLYGNFEDLKNHGGNISIGKGLKSFDSNYIQNTYKSIVDSQELLNGKYIVKFPSDLINEGQIKNIVGEDNFNDSLLQINFDNLFVYFWLIGVKFGYNFSFIKGKYSGKNISELKGKSLLIAENRAEKSFPDVENVLINITPSRKPKLNGLTVYECTFPIGRKGQDIISVEKGKTGIPGISFSGDIISNGELKTISPSDYLDGNEDFVEIIEKEDGGFLLRAKIDCYISKDKKTGKYFFSKDKIFFDEIWSETGSLILPKGESLFILKAGINKGFFIDGGNIKLEYGYIEGNVICDNDLEINNELNGTDITLNGCDILSSGNISIGKNVKIFNNSIIKAVNGRIIIEGNLENTTIIGDDIEIKGSAKNCIIVGRKVKINKNLFSKVLGENIDVNFSNSGINILAVYSGLSPYFNLLKSKVEILTKEISDLELRINILKEEFKRETDSKQKAKIAKDGADLSKKLDSFKEQLKKDNFAFNMFNDDDLILSIGYCIDEYIRIAFIPFILNEAIRNLFNPGQNIDRLKQYDVLLKYFDEHGIEKVVLNGLTLGQIKIDRKQLNLEINKYSEGNNHIRRDSDRVDIFKSGRRIQVVVDGILGNIYDYSDNGSSYVVTIDNTKEFLIKEKTIITVNLFGKELAFFVTRIDKREQGKNNLYRISGHYIEFGVGKFIQSEINRLETLGNKN